MMKKVLLSAFACDPTKGSEPSYGWNWAVGLAEQGFEVHCITREDSKAEINKKVLPPNLTFHYLSLPVGMEVFYSASNFSMYLYYMLWQWKAYKLALSLHEVGKFDFIHHVTWGSVQLGSFMYRVDAPFIFGPAGGGQTAPKAFKHYFGDAWSVEKTRARVSRLFLKLNPACKDMLKKASTVLVSNVDTLRMAELQGCSNAHLAIDPGLPRWFLPEVSELKAPRHGELKLLWVGRLMPRKGVLLALEVMKHLKDYPGITLTVVGDGPMRESLLEATDRYGLEDSVLWKGRVAFAEVRDYYANSDVFLFTSLRDSCPMQLVEAMAYGMPVVTLDLHGQSLIVDPDRGFKCAADTPEVAIENLKAAILELHRNADLVTRLSGGAYKFAANHVWDKKIGSIVDEFYCS